MDKFLKIVSLGAIRDVSAADGFDPLPVSQKYYMRLQWVPDGKEFEVSLNKETFEHISEHRGNFDSASEMKLVIEAIQQRRALNASPD